MTEAPVPVVRLDERAHALALQITAETNPRRRELLVEERFAYLRRAPAERKLCALCGHELEPRP